MIKLHEVSKFYKTKNGVSEGMRKVNLNFKLNEFVAITGESGSGKTTLLNVISGLDSYEDGELFVNGLETSHYSVKDWEEFRAANVGFVFQNYNVIDSYTVYQNVVIALEAQGFNESGKKERALELIDKVGLTSHKNQRTSKLSGGQKQRVVIARALAKNAPIILADEPTGNLDEQSGKEIMELLKDISKDKLIILVTHNYEEAKNYITRNVVMQDGGIKSDKVIHKSEYELIDRIEENHLADESVLKVSSKLAFRNLLSTPKRTIFSILLSMLAVTIFLGFYSSLIKEASASILGLTDNNTASISLRDSSFYNKESLNYLNKYKSDNIEIIPVTGYLYLEYIAETEDEQNRDRMFTLYSTEYLFEDRIRGNNGYDYEEEIIDGRLPIKENEIIISQYEIFGKKLNDKVELSTFNGESKEYTIVGFYGSRNKNSDFYYNSSVYMLPQHIYDENYQVNEYFVGQENSSQTTNIYEVLIYGSDRSEIELLKNKFKKNEMEDYRFIDKYVIEQQPLAFVFGFFKLFFWGILIFILALVFLVIYNIFKNVMDSRKKDFAVYRSIGISEKEVGFTILFEQLMIAIISVMLTIIFINIFATQFDFIRSISRHLVFTDYLFVALVFAVFSLILGFKYNRKIFNITVIDSLKEENQ